jgi:hypothetical protein
MGARLFPLAVAATVLASGPACDDRERATGADGNAVCDALVAEYEAAWPAALLCDPGEATGCGASRPQPVSDANHSLVGLGCAGAVNPGRTAALDGALARFDAAGCKVLPLPCPPGLLHAAVPCPASGSCW